ncbi:hypothetical protein NL394_23545 (plasmid) [Paenarthrobacter ureafaciens]|uniref:HTH marR-type domain-containing protein n=3 Tax=Paenarthrobacter TaxID=1742992 RepID=A0AAX3EQP0_PAEUR|nr:helix-turn-helix domain-containing protein [Paenarthrobacter ureafaciens]UYV95526.1 hypothetical protein NL395_23160 [Paenarthrobacter ureafaciens]UYW00127.1 hypothetical protein NL394_23545 [Paenarthrobacter ureafaciens]
MGTMPRLVPPNSGWSDSLEIAIQCFGSGPKNMVIAFLQRNPNSFRSEIAEGTGLKAATLQNQIDHLLEWGVIESDIPTDKRGRGRASRYSADSERISLLLDALREYLLGADQLDK